jgi:hypothetical protein
MFIDFKEPEGNNIPPGILQKSCLFAEVSNRSHAGKKSSFIYLVA